jgi:hypothetical protein
MLSSSESESESEEIITGTQSIYAKNIVWSDKEKPVNYWSVAEKIFMRFIFPPVLLWDGLKWAVNKLAGEALGKIVLQAAGDSSLAAYATPSKKEHNIVKAISSHHKKSSPKLTLTPITIITEDNAQLDTLEFSYPQSQEYIINFRGNGECYEHPQNLDQMVKDAYKLGINVIGFNYRGVNNSQGKAKSKNDLVRDGIAQVTYLIEEKKILPENIILKGHSLGGGVAALVAKHFHRQGLPINIIDGCSFSNITNFAVGHIRAFGKNPEDKHSFTSLLTKNVFKALGYIAMPFIKLALALTKWEMEAASAFKEIPSENKEYYLVRSSKKTRNPDPEKNEVATVIPVDDIVIPHYSSLYRDEDLRKVRRKAKANNKKIIKYYNKQIMLAAYDDEHMKEQYKQSIDKVLDNEKRLINKRKMVHDNPWENAHGAELHELSSRYEENINGKFYKKTANEFFYEFIARLRTQNTSNHELRKTNSKQSTNQPSKKNLSQVTLYRSDESAEYKNFF